MAASGLFPSVASPQAASGAFTFSVSPDDPRAGDCVWIEVEAPDPLVYLKFRVSGGLKPVYRSVREFRGADGKVERVHWIWVIPNAPRGRFDVSLGARSDEKDKRYQGEAVLTVEAPKAAPPNRLANGDFEQGMTAAGGGAAVPTGWQAWAAGAGPAPERVPQSVRDEKQAVRVRHGEWAWRMAGRDAKHDAGLLQTVKVAPGARLRLRAHAHAWTSVNDDATLSQGQQKYLLRVGIDPEGGKDPAAPGVVWSKPVESPDRWTALAAEADAKGETATVFLRGTADAAVKHNESYWDYVTLTAE